MKNIIAIAKRITESYENEEPFIWQVWKLDTWGNEQDGWEVNDRYKSFTFECYSDDEEDIISAFEKEFSNNYSFLKRNQIEYEWIDQDVFYMNDKETGEYLFEIEKIK